MKRPILLAAAAALCTAPALAQDLPIPSTKYSLEQCLGVVLAAYPAKVKAVEMEIEQGVPTYEFEIKTHLDGMEWEVECDANSGRIAEVEREVERDDPAFVAAARVSAADALKTALTAHPGMLQEVEYEVGPSGEAKYEFTILGKGATLTEVEVDAKTGQITRTENERDEIDLYRIGADD